MRHARRIVRDAAPDMVWVRSNRADPVARRIADRHYNRQKPGTPQFVPPGRCLVMTAPVSQERRALWVSSWPFAEYVKHAWAGAWVCCCFRNEGAGVSSDLIRQAVAATVWEWEPVPALGFITFVNAQKVRRKRDPGRCYRRAGWSHVGFTKGGLWTFQLLPTEMPPSTPLAEELPLFVENT